MTKCPGVHRSPKGDRLLALLATDPEHPEVTDLVKTMRGTVPEYLTMTFAAIVERLTVLIAAIPKKCPECDNSND